MLNAKRNFFLSLSLFFLTLIFTSCPADINCKIENNDVKIKFYTKAGNELVNLINSFSDSSNFSNDEDSFQLFNSDEIKTGLEMSGLKNVSVKTIDSKTLDATFTVQGDSKIPGLTDLVRINKNEASKNAKGKTEFVLTQKIIQDIYNLSDRNIQRYCDMLIAPVITGDEMTSDEYKDLISSVYGSKLSDELLSGNFTINVTSVDQKKTVQIPVSKILTLTENDAIIISLE